MLHDVLLILHIIGFSLMIGWAAGVLLLPIVTSNTKKEHRFRYLVCYRFGPDFPTHTGEVKALPWRLSLKPVALLRPEYSGCTF